MEMKERLGEQCRFCRGKEDLSTSWELWGRQTSVQIASYLREEHPARDVTIARDHCNCGREATMRY